MTRIDWRPLTGLIHAYREQAVAEIEAALPELSRGRPGVPVRIKYTLHGYQAQLGVMVDKQPAVNREEVAS